MSVLRVRMLKAKMAAYRSPSSVGHTRAFFGVGRVLPDCTTAISSGRWIRSVESGPWDGWRDIRECKYKKSGTIKLCA